MILPVLREFSNSIKPTELPNLPLKVTGEDLFFIYRNYEGTGTRIILALDFCVFDGSTKRFNVWALNRGEAYAPEGLTKVNFTYESGGSNLSMQLSSLPLKNSGVVVPLTFTLGSTSMSFNVIVKFL